MVDRDLTQLVGIEGAREHRCERCAEHGNMHEVLVGLAQAEDRRGQGGWLETKRDRIAGGRGFQERNGGEVRPAAPPGSGAPPPPTPLPPPRPPPPPPPS